MRGFQANKKRFVVAGTTAMLLSLARISHHDDEPSLDL